MLNMNIFKLNNVKIGPSKLNSSKDKLLNISDIVDKTPARILKNFQKFENTTTITSSESKSSSLFRKLLGNGLNMYKQFLLQPIIL